MTVITDAYSYLTHVLTTRFADTDMLSRDQDGQRSATISPPGRQPVEYQVSCQAIIEQGERLIQDLKNPTTSDGVLRAIYAGHGRKQDEIPGSMGYSAPRFIAWEVETAKYHLGLPYNANP